MRKTWFEKKFGDISMLVIIVPGVAFLMTYGYSLGYYEYFNIPRALITVGAKDMASMILLVLIAVFLFFLFDFLLVQFFYKFFFKCYPINSKIYQDQFLIYCFTIFMIIMLASMRIIDAIPKNMMTIFIWVLVFFLILFVFYHISFLIKKKNNKRIQMVHEENDEDSNKYPGIIELIFGTRLVFTIFFVICLFIFALGLGSFDARNQRTFYSIENRSEIIGILINDKDQLMAKYVNDKELLKTEVINVSAGVCFEIRSNTEFVRIAEEYNSRKKRKQ